MYEHELEAARVAAHAAATVIMEHYARFTAIADAPASISTEADRVAQETILDHITDRCPGDAVRAEEATPTLQRLTRSGSRLWVVDPIDGTRGFARKNGEFSVMIAFVHEGEVKVGIVTEPAHKRYMYAVRGGGCWRQDGSDRKPTRVSVTDVAELAEATLTQSHTRPDKGPTKAVRKLSPGRIIETYSAGIKLGQVARGEADLYPCDYDALNDWDLAAGHILVEEAGGRVTDLYGQPIRYGAASSVHAGGVLASNGRLHDATIKALASGVA
jgi:3'(2'), 5'-bisphosphate nucleotidase